jgi:hypothetical protein
LTLDQAAVLNDTNYALFSASMLQKISKLIKEEKFDLADIEIKRYRSLVDEIFSKKEAKKDLDKFNERVDTLEKVLKSKLKKKGGRGGTVLMKSKGKSTKIAKPSVKARSRGRGKKMAEESESEAE